MSPRIDRYRLKSKGVPWDDFNKGLIRSTDFALITTHFTFEIIFTDPPVPHPLPSPPLSWLPDPQAQLKIACT
jgi:hypothetical protein